MPIYTNDPCDDGLFPVEPSLRSSIGIGPKVTKAIDAATKDWLDNHPEATTTVEDNSLTNAKFMDGSVNSRVIEDESITTDEIADGAVTTPKIADGAVTTPKIADNSITSQKLANNAIDAMPTMSTAVRGVAKVGAGLAMNNGALELNGGDIAPAVTAWLDAHPEATTTVEDESITNDKIANNTITDAKLVQSNGILDTIQCAVKTVVPEESEVLTGKFIDAQGVEQTSDNFVATEYLNVFGCGGSTIRARSTLNGAAGITFFDSEKNLLLAVNGNNRADYGITGSGHWFEYKITAPVGTAYVRLCGWAATYSGPSDFYFMHGYLNDTSEVASKDYADAINSKTSEAIEMLGGIEYWNLINPDEVVENAIIDRNTGRVEANNNYNATGYIWLEPNTTYHSRQVFGDNWYAFYDSDKTFVSDADVERVYTNMWDVDWVVGDTGYYLRAIVSKTTTPSPAYISSIVDTYMPYGIVTIEDMLDRQDVSNRSKVLVLGDSISTDAYGSYKKWVTVLMEQGFLNSDTVNSSQHASGFVARYNNGENDFISRVTAIEDKDSFDMVVVFGGINDYIQSVPMGGGDGETSITTYFKPAVDYFFEYLIQNFTQARICVLLPLRTFATWTNSVGEYQQAYSEYIHTVAKRYCLPVLNLTEESGFCPFIPTFRDMWTLLPTGYDTHDGVHPNVDYEREFLAPMIKDFLAGL